jgi:hypothetical protein
MRCIYHASSHCCVRGCRAGITDRRGLACCCYRTALVEDHHSQRRHLLRLLHLATWIHRSQLYKYLASGVLYCMEVDGCRRTDNPRPRSRCRHGEFCGTRCGTRCPVVLRLGLSAADRERGILEEQRAGRECGCRTGLRDTRRCAAQGSAEDFRLIPSTYVVHSTSLARVLCPHGYGTTVSTSTVRIECPQGGLGDARLSTVESVASVLDST